MTNISLTMAVADETTITIFHTNDLHQNLKPLARIAKHVARHKADNPNTVFVDAGDWFDRGSSLVAITRGEALLVISPKFDP